MEMWLWILKWFVIAVAGWVLLSYGAYRLLDWWDTRRDPSVAALASVEPEAEVRQQQQPRPARKLVAAEGPSHRHVSESTSYMIKQARHDSPWSARRYNFQTAEEAHAFLDENADLFEDDDAFVVKVTHRVVTTTFEERVPKS